MFQILTFKFHCMYLLYVNCNRMGYPHRWEFHPYRLIHFVAYYFTECGKEGTPVLFLERANNILYRACHPPKKLNSL